MQNSLYYYRISRVFIPTPLSCSVVKKRTRKISLGRDNTETTILCPIYWLRLIVSRHVLNELHDEIKANVRNPCRHPSRTRIVLLNSTTTILTFGYSLFISLTRLLRSTPILRMRISLYCLWKRFNFRTLGLHKIQIYILLSLYILLSCRSFPTIEYHHRCIYFKIGIIRCVLGLLLR